MKVVISIIENMEYEFYEKYDILKLYSRIWFAK